MPVTVDSSSSESVSEESESKPESDSSDSSDLSDSSDSSNSSDSDGLENWMILGRGNQDGDQSISLNLEGASNSIVSAGVSSVDVWLHPCVCVCVCAGVASAMSQYEDRVEGVPPSKITLCGEHDSQTKAQR